MLDNYGRRIFVKWRTLRFTAHYPTPDTHHSLFTVCDFWPIFLAIFTVKHFSCSIEWMISGDDCLHYEYILDLIIFVAILWVSTSSKLGHKIPPDYLRPSQSTTTHYPLFIKISAFLQICSAIGKRLCSVEKEHLCQSTPGFSTNPLHYDLRSHYCLLPPPPICLFYDKGRSSE